MDSKIMDSKITNNIDSAKEVFGNRIQDLIDRIFLRQDIIFFCDLEQDDPGYIYRVNIKRIPVTEEMKKREEEFRKNNDRPLP